MRLAQALAFFSLLFPLPRLLGNALRSTLDSFPFWIRRGAWDGGLRSPSVTEWLSASGRVE